MCEVGVGSHGTAGKYVASYGQLNKSGLVVLQYSRTWGFSHRYGPIEMLEEPMERFPPSGVDVVRRSRYVACKLSEGLAQINLQSGVVRDVGVIVGVSREIARCLLDSGTYGLSGGLVLPVLMFICVLLHAAGRGWERTCNMYLFGLWAVDVGAARTLRGRRTVLKWNLVAVEVDRWKGFMVIKVLLVIVK